MVEFNTPALQRYRAWRYTKDRLATSSIAVGGSGVLATILTIFIYLVYEVTPLFDSASVDADKVSFQVEQSGKTWYLAMEEQAEVAMRLNNQGEVSFFTVADGQTLNTIKLPLGGELQGVAVQADESRSFAVGNDAGQVLLAQHNYRITYPGDKRLISPYLSYPDGEKPLLLDEKKRALKHLAYGETESASFYAAFVGEQLMVWKISKEENFLSGEMVVSRHQAIAPNISGNIKSMLIDSSGQWLFVLSEEQRLSVLNIDDIENDEVSIVDTVDLSASPVTEMKLLLGGISVMLAHESGSISQYFLARNEKRQWYMAQVREFEHSQSIGFLLMEQRRKGFLSIDNEGYLSIFNSTSQRELFDKKLFKQAPVAAALSPRAKTLLVETAPGQYRVVGIHNEHPEVSFYTLWQKVWYESYDEPEYIWQSSAANNDFEPKYSLMPLSFGTLKAAFYAMLLGAPLAVCGAIFTAYFMAPAMRKRIKPLLELMEALPTVILGFLAGLWLAPFMEANLAAVFSLLVFLPIGILFTSFLWIKMPSNIRFAVTDGWEALLLVPVVIFIAWVCIAANGYIEMAFFGGDMRIWITHNLGISFDQRNALVVGVAMGFAVIPTIFSIAEDAVFSVPKHLSFGSFALGATRWQTLVGVVLPTASPGIFSALMIGLGRAVGETMIVLMATGNTPIMDVNIFEGMRTLAANIAVEMPEAEVNSSHYRVLFLAALVLFMFTFIVNTVAELVRQRLRKKYGQL